MNNNYKDKYLKYKNKYLQLKEQFGNGISFAFNYDINYPPIVITQEKIKQETDLLKILAEHLNVEYLKNAEYIIGSASRNIEEIISYCKNKRIDGIERIEIKNSRNAVVTVIKDLNQLAEPFKELSLILNKQKSLLSKIKNLYTDDTDSKDYVIYVIFQKKEENTKYIFPPLYSFCFDKELCDSQIFIKKLIVLCESDKNNKVHIEIIKFILSDDKINYHSYHLNVIKRILFSTQEQEVKQSLSRQESYNTISTETIDLTHLREPTNILADLSLDIPPGIPPGIPPELKKKRKYIPRSDSNKTYMSVTDSDDPTDVNELDKLDELDKSDELYKIINETETETETETDNITEIDLKGMRNKIYTDKINSADIYTDNNTRNKELFDSYMYLYLNNPAVLLVEHYKHLALIFFKDTDKYNEKFNLLPDYLKNKPDIIKYINFDISEFTS